MREVNTTIISRRQISHPHTDLSVHLYLSLVDAKMAIEKGQVEKHLLATPGTAWFHMAPNYLCFYGPRNEDELEVLRGFLRNSLRFMTGNEGINF